MKLTEQPTIIEAAKKSGVDIDDPAHAAAIEAALQIGIAQERERVIAHLRLGGPATGGLKLAYNAIEAGEPMTPASVASYVESTRWAAELAAREADDVVVQAAIQNVARPPSAFVDPLERQVANRLAELLDTSAGDANIEDLEP